MKSFYLSWMCNAHCAWTRGYIFGTNSVGFNFYKTHWYSFIFCPKKYGKTVALASGKALTRPPPPLFTFPGVEDRVNTTKKEREATTGSQKKAQNSRPPAYIYRKKALFVPPHFPHKKGNSNISFSSFHRRFSVYLIPL